MTKTLIAALGILILTLSSNAQGPVRRVDTLQELVSAINPSAVAVNGKATYIVTGRTNKSDQELLFVDFDASATNAHDGYLVFTNAYGPGRWKVLSEHKINNQGFPFLSLIDNQAAMWQVISNQARLSIRTNSATTAGVLPPAQTNRFYVNGDWRLFTNVFSIIAGTNMQVVATENSVTISMTNTATGSSIKWEGIPITNPNLKDTVYVYWVPSGSDLRAYVTQNGLDPTRWEEVPQGQFLIRISPGVGDLEYGYIGSNLNLNPVTGELSAVIPVGTNSWQIAANGTLVLTPSIDDSPEIYRITTSTNIKDYLVAGSVSTNKIDTTFLDLLLNQHRVNQLTRLPLVLTNSTGVGGVIFATNANGHITGTVTNFPVGSGGGTNYVNGVQKNPLYLTNSTDTTFTEIGTGNWGVTINPSRFYSLLTNSIIASNNVSIAYDGGALKLMLSAAASGGTGTAVTVDGGSDLVRINLADASTTGLIDISGTNATFRLPDRDFGDITVGSSGAGMTINANSVALGTDTTGNYVATVAGTANKVDVSGSGSETAAVTVTLSDTIDLGGHTSFEIPNSSAPTTDAFGEIAGDANAWASGRGAVQFFDGTSNTYLVGVQASDTPSNGQVQKWNTGGTITWEDDNAGGISDGDKGDVTVSSSGTAWAIDNDVVTYAKMQNVSAASRILGRGDSGSGDMQELTAGTGLVILGTTIQLTNNVPTDYYAGGYLPLFAGYSNALTGQLFFRKPTTDQRIVFVDDSNITVDRYLAMGLRHYNGKFSIYSFNTNDFTADEEFMVVDPKTDETYDIITFPNSGFNNKVVFDANVEFNGTVTGSGIGDVISTANNNFTQTNNFAGPINAATVTVNDNAYSSSWNGSTNVVTANAVYDKIQTILSETTGYITSDQSTTSATAVNVTGMSFSIGANEVWGVEWYLGVTCSGVAGAKFAINGPSGMTVGGQAKGNGASPLIITALATLTSAVTTAATGAVTVHALCQASSTGGTVQLQFASADGVVTATIKGNQTFFKATKLN